MIDLDVDVNVFAVLTGGIVLAAATSIALLFTNTNFGFATFKLLFPAAMLLSAITLVTLAVHIIQGSETTSLHWQWAAASGVVATLCICYGLWGFTESHEESLQKDTRESLKRDARL